MERTVSVELPRESVKAYRLALLEKTRERAPLAWAKTQNNLGLALSRLGERENSSERLREALDSYRAALLEHARERVPLMWAMTQNNLGIALARLGQHENSSERLSEAVEAFRLALLERKRERVPLLPTRLRERLPNVRAAADMRGAFDSATRTGQVERLRIQWLALHPTALPDC